MSIVHWINKHSAILPRSQAVITAEYGWNDSDFGPEPFPGSVYHRGTGQLVKDIKIAPWGRNNRKPYEWLKLLKESNIAPQLLMTKVDFACGEKLITYKEDIQQDAASGELRIVKVPVVVPELSQWLRQIKAETLMRKRATDYYFSGNCFAQMVTARDPDRFGISFIDHVDGCDVRAEKMKKERRKIEHYFVSDDWAKPVYNPKQIDKSNTRRYKTFTESDPLRYYRSIHHSKIYWPGQKYYGIQPWHSGANWIGFANKIPVWMGSNISNSYNIKYHLKYPENYFDYCENWEDKEREKEKERVFDQIDKWLAGEKNVSKTFFSKHFLDPMTGQKTIGWEIEAIKNDIQDDAFVEAYKTSQGALTSGWDLNPSLADIPQEGKFAISGSELRIAYQIHIALKVTAARSIMVEPLELAYKVNHDIGVPGFSDPEIKFGFINKNITTLAESKAGMTTAA